MFRSPVAFTGVVAALTATLLTACGSDDDGAQTTTEPATELVVTVDPGDGVPDEWSLTCDPPGGTHPDPEAACAALADLDPDVMAAVPGDQMCTQQFGGPQTATIAGRWDGTDVDASFSRENGCEIARWDALVDVLQHSGDGALSSS
jgi:hypothetical protein